MFFFVHSGFFILCFTNEYKSSPRIVLAPVGCPTFVGGNPNIHDQMPLSSMHSLHICKELQGLCTFVSQDTLQTKGVDNKEGLAEYIHKACMGDKDKGIGSQFKMLYTRAQAATADAGETSYLE